MQSEEFKAAVGKYPTGVTVISTEYNNKFYGFTANSFTSVSLEPVFISFCLNKEASSFNAFLNAKNFAVNILSSVQEDIAIRFASRGNDKFQNIDFIQNSVGTPIISNVLSSIECNHYKHIECGDHYIFIGQVFKVQINNNLVGKSPLVYYGKSYRELK